MAKKRKGMIIKNTNVRPVDIEMESRTIRLKPGEEHMITAEEVRDARMREKLQVRAVSIVRPTTDVEEEELKRRLAEEEKEQQ
jgi:N-acetylmuramic acid 6-phosphate (MurNAc-6-P) etherase